MSRWTYAEALRKQQSDQAILHMGCGCVAVLVKLAFFGLVVVALLHYIRST